MFDAVCLLVCAKPVQVPPTKMLSTDLQPKEPVSIRDDVTMCSSPNRVNFYIYWYRALMFSKSYFGKGS